MNIFLVSLCFLSFANWATPFVDEMPAGQYVGSGKWSDNLEQHGEYQARVEISSEKIISEYSWQGGSQVIEWKIEAFSLGNFQMSADEGRGRASGYCDASRSRCTYYFAMGQHQGKEELIFDHEAIAGRLHKSGYELVGPNHEISWETDLDLVIAN